MTNLTTHRLNLNARFLRAWFFVPFRMSAFFGIISLLMVVLIGVSGLRAAEPTPKKKQKQSSKLVEYEVFNLIQSKSIQKSLTGKAGNPKRGEALIIDREKGNCLQCHVIDKFHELAKKNPDTYGDMGEIGPTLDGVATRYKDGQLRLILVNAKLVFPETIMPAYYRIDGFTRVADEYVDQPIMSAQDIEDILSFLKTLK